ncbi:MAG: LemA family protein [Deltaproteobacteria bacterium]|nr:LemA family protein [Deltaproteobacteria bacterium]
MRTIRLRNPHSSTLCSYRLPFVSLLALLALGLSGCGYNTMVSMKEEVNSAWAQVENQLQRRNDLIPNLVETTKGYAAHEKEIFESVANARSKLIGAGSNRGEQIEAANQVSSALSRLLALSERYPDLKADKQFARLSDELAGTENRIATERRRYNEVVQAYNTYIKSFPAVMMAGWFGFGPEKYFEAPKEAQQVPQVKF